MVSVYEINGLKITQTDLQVKDYENSLWEAGLVLPDLPVKHRLSASTDLLRYHRELALAG